MITSATGMSGTVKKMRMIERIESVGFVRDLFDESFCIERKNKQLYAVNLNQFVLN